MDNSFEKLINRILDNRYKIENVVGIGGMAYVLKAIDLKDNNKPVAIKILNEEFNSDENAVKRFVNESKAVAMLDSPNIVKIFDVAISDSLKYIVMEFIDGITLKDYIDKVGRLGWKEACHYTRQILQALTHAHEKAIVHRDIKPQNVMLLRDGTVKVTDFGIAKMPTSEPLTMTDKAIGTVNYISPEQASGGTVDEKSDIYSVGVMLYEMLTGTLPFKAESPVAVAMMQVSEEPKPPREINAQIPVGLEQIVLKTMSKEPTDRFNSAMSMEKAIEYFVKNPATVFTGVPASGAKKADKGAEEKKRSMLPVILGITVGFIAVCIIVALVAIFTIGEEFFGGSKNESKKIEIDDYIGMQYTDELKKELEEKNFLVVVKDDENPSEENGKILRQDPVGGTKKLAPDKNRRIQLTLYVNNNPEESFVMPQCLDLTLSEAKDMILTRFEGIITEDKIKVEESHKDVTKGTVYECNPAVGASIDINNPPKITLYVSKGPEPEEVIMPDVIGEKRTKARQILEEAKISYTEERRISDEPVNTVVETSIEAGEKFMNDTEVILYISEKSHGDSFTMPNVIHDKKDTALSAIAERFHINTNDISVIEEYNDDVSRGRVYKTIPDSGTMITDFAATRITLYVSLGNTPRETVMPNVVGKTLSTANALLKDAGLGNVTVKYGNFEAEKNTIVAANYVEGDVIYEDSEIILTVSSGAQEDADTEDENDEMDDLLGMRG